MVHRGKIKTQVVIPCVTPTSPAFESSVVAFDHIPLQLPIRLNIRSSVRLFDNRALSSIVKARGLSLPFSLMQSAFTKMDSTWSRSSQSVNQITPVWINGRPHGYIPIVVIEMTEIFRVGVDFPPHRPIESIAYVTDLFSEKIWSPLPFESNIRRG